MHRTMSGARMKVHGVQDIPCILKGELCGVYGSTIKKIHPTVVDKQYSLGPDHTYKIYKVFWMKLRPFKPCNVIKGIEWPNHCSLV